ncbi:ShlB/FhaC/HecB family hemolysin secretion/activation protein [Yersinia kristensenii]|uniref:ShlB/FhaC/HecB family hemolysin secretion/activation protein n=1 Tax=Yersinia kristensenii TaxID=28152 RepID=UPI0005E17AE0|nr:ShlB/FhaC/HecB family hemolysin secretion/activation protein [Yersinia kristensenii]MDA5475164.1 ShlB/FhaC/HecB family hemolysin secretion/activation protein [Yersinia kristensenii]MDA5479049.1 ShlB/FhaC/HecB family hemolysin secretion/activation protein [Yersinia kristensenii]MDA5524883.1 ShlB/FhaC/HecB family hemolysin secretion/activation protein [Yersinia kristensenii]MDR4899223.1 ShlB/FhaC/HecB family hemolysin secretion/activation protein [Yersinia kristensenii]MDX6736632.1 ShlB/FhaC/
MRHFYYPEKLRCQAKLSSSVIVFTLFFCTQVVAAPQLIRVPPNAGTISSEIRQTTQEPLRAPQEAEIKLPPLAPSATAAHSTLSERIILHEVKFEGDTQLLLPSDGNNKALRTVITPWLGQRLTFNDLQAMTLAVTRFYRQQGFVAAQAILPPQTIREGVVVVRILAGRLDKPEVNNQSRLNMGFATAVIESNSCSKEVGFFGDKDCAASPVELSRLERTALILNEMPGIDASLALKPGTKSGMTRIYADITHGQTAMGYIGADNQGNDYSGHNRLLVGGALNNMTGWGDQLRADLILSSSADVFNGMLDYNFPINTYGTRAAVNYSYLDYTLKGPFDILDARGHSNTWGINLRHPWIRHSAARIDATAGYYQSRMRDSLIMLPEQKRNLDAGELGINGTFTALPRGLSNFYLLGTAGHLSLDDEFSQSISSLTGIGGTFARFNYRAGHDQGFGPYFSFFNQFTGQMASKNLDSSQKLLLGGPLAVRAYGIGEGAVDKGTIFTTELRARWEPPLPDWTGVGNQITFAAFFDQGWGSYYRQPIEALTGNNINLSGFGAYITLSRPADYSLNLTWAHRTGQAATPQPDNDQLWLSAYKMF